MTVQSSLTEPGRVDEPRLAQEYSDVLSQVVAEGKPMIVRRNGEDLAAVIPLEHDLIGLGRCIEKHPGKKHIARVHLHRRLRSDERMRRLR